MQSPEEVYDVIRRAAYFSIFSVPDPAQLSQGVPLVPFIPQILQRIDITESPRRHQLVVSPPTAQCGFRTTKQGSSRPIAYQHLVLDMMPNNFQAADGRQPWQTPLLPFLSQRFYMSQGEFDFLDPAGSGFRAHASGRFFPARVAGELQLRIGVIVEILVELGLIRGHPGNLVVNGYTTPPSIFANSFVMRFVDPDGELTTDEPIPPIADPLPDTEPFISFLPFITRRQAGTAFTVTPTGDGGKVRVTMSEEVRLVDTNFDVVPRLRSRTVPGPVVGEHQLTLVFDPDFDKDVIPLYSTTSEFRFFTADRLPIGTLTANLFEGRAFRTTLPQLDQPFFRITGFGPFTRGTGQFSNPIGMISLNGAMSLSGAVSSMYMLRIADPSGRFRSPVVAVGEDRAAARAAAGGS